jgi:16S rRNA processing protein RimM
VNIEWIPIGRVNRTHGLRGELKFAPLSDEGEALENLQRVKLAGPPAVELEVEGLRGVPGSRIIKFKRVGNVEAAKALTGQTLYRHREDFPPLGEGEYYRFEIEGLEAYDDAGRCYGRVVDIIATGSNDVYVVRDKAGHEILLPMIDSVIHTIDVRQGKLVFHVVEGLIEDASV